jgi:hypothetical protein
MARPEKNTVEYFPFICDDGKKMFYIEETYGNDGFSTFIKILRELAKTEFHYLDLSKPITMMFLSAKCKVSKEILENIIKDLVELGKFDNVLWSENKIIWCQDFIDSIQDAYNKRKNECISYEGLLLLLKSLGVRKPTKLQSKDPVNTQTILENTKVNKTILERRSEFKNSLRPFLEDYPKDLINDFFEYWSEHGSNDRKMRYEKEKSFGLSRRLSTWNKRQKTFEKEKNVAPKKENAGIALQRQMGLIK